MQGEATVENVEPSVFELLAMDSNDPAFGSPLVKLGADEGANDEDESEDQGEDSPEPLPVSNKKAVVDFKEIERQTNTKVSKQQNNTARHSTKW